MSDDRAVPTHRFTLAKDRLAPYYTAGERLRDKHAATSGALAFPEWALDRLEPLPGSHALDVGCGWGRFSVPLLRRLAAAGGRWRVGSFAIEGGPSCP